MAKLHNKNKYFIHIRNLEQALSHGLVLKKVYHRIIKFNQNTCLKSYVDMNTELREKWFSKNVFSNWWITQFLKRRWYEYRAKRKMISENIFSNWWITQFLKKTKLLKILKSTTQIKKRISSLDNMVADRISNKKLGLIITELFI